MSGSKVLASDSLLNTKTWFHPSDDGNKYTIETKQDVTDIVEVNKELYNDVNERTPFKGEHEHRVASVPLIILMKLKRDGILDDQKAFRKWLNDPDNRAFRTRPGRV